jgi:hypothetical protein
MTILLATIFMVNDALATPPNQDVSGEIYIVQTDDWLSKIAEKFYGDVLAYPAIVAATNAKAAEDDRFAFIGNPDLIEVGQGLWIPDRALADEILTSPTILANDDVTIFKYFIHPDIGTYEFRVTDYEGWVNKIDIYDSKNKTLIQTINNLSSDYDLDYYIPDRFLDVLDYNFDGYNDLRYIKAQGGRSVYVRYDIWLFEPETKQFVLNEVLSSWHGPSNPIPEKKEIIRSSWSITSLASEIYIYREQKLVLVRKIQECWMEEEFCVEYLEREYQGDVTDLIDLAGQSWGVEQDFGVLGVSEPDEGLVCLSIFVPDEDGTSWTHIGEQIVVQGDATKCKSN